MHERSLVRALLRQVEVLAAEHPATRVIGIRVRIGEFSGVEAELLQSAYDDLIEYSALSGAELSVEQVPLEAVCEQCGQRFHIDNYQFECTKCGSVKLEISGGEELLLDSIQLEEELNGEQSTCGNARGPALPK